MWGYTREGQERNLIADNEKTAWSFQFVVTQNLFQSVVRCQDLISMAYQSKYSEVNNVFGLAGQQIFVTTCFDRPVSKPIRSKWKGFANSPLSDIYNIFDYVGDWTNIATMYYNETVDSFVIIDKKGDMFVCPVDDAAERIRNPTVNKVIKIDLISI